MVNITDWVALASLWQAPTDLTALYTSILNTLCKDIELSDSIHHPGY
jgi:hypothetical protein